MRSRWRLDAPCPDCGCRERRRRVDPSRLPDGKNRAMADRAARGRLNRMEEDFEIKGAHEAEVEDAAEHHVPLAQKIALFSAVVATIGAVFSFLAGHTQNEALYHKDEA